MYFMSPPYDLQVQFKLGALISKPEQYQTTRSNHEVPGYIITLLPPLNSALLDPNILQSVIYRAHNNSISFNYILRKMSMQAEQTPCIGCNSYKV
jgi:hypothetical protein